MLFRAGFDGQSDEVERQIARWAETYGATFYARDPALSVPGPTGFDYVIVAPGGSDAPIDGLSFTKVIDVATEDLEVLDTHCHDGAIHSFVTLHRRPGWTSADFHRYWRDDHAALVLQTRDVVENMCTYVQHHVLDTTPSNDIDGVAHSAFPTRDAMKRIFRSPQRPTVAEDELTFLDGSRSIVTLCRRVAA